MGKNISLFDIFQNVLCLFVCNKFAECDDDIPTTPPHSPQDCHERTIRTQAEKHALTPESKAAAESKPKRFAGLLIYVYDNTLFVTISLKQIDTYL